jgi:aspartyl-tRNA(Asn)/glutamyl-tRNA(Gln) amidotransferase subunit A
VRRIIRDESKRLLEEYDFLMSPTTPGTAFHLGDKTADPIQMYLGDIFTVQAPLAGMPAISIPTGKDEDGMPIGTQFMGNSFNESELLNFSGQVFDLYENN